MCGIAGIASIPGAPPPKMDQLKAMCDSIYHRGPDSEGIELSKNVGLGMRRLAIIDLAGGKQPIFNEDRSVSMVFNGEIYNFREIRKNLESKGHRFSSSTDGEVIVHLWEEYGLDFASHLNGMFGIAIHDRKKNKLILVRDRLGIKPLFFYLNSKYLIFGSEIKAILASGLVDKKLNLNALAEFLSWEYVPAPRTLLQGINKLEPAGLLEIDLTSFQSLKKTWWEIPSFNNDIDQNLNSNDPLYWEEVIDAKIKQSVKSQLISDVPLGAFLSGGVDSSLVVSAMENAHTFSIGFDDPSYNEINWSKRVADHLGVTHKVETINPNITDLFFQLMNFMDDPIGDFSIFPTYLVSSLARKDVTVVLSGDGGDEVFGGYETFVAQEKARLWQRYPPFLGRNVVEYFINKIRPTSKKKGLINKAKRFVEGLRCPEGLGHARWRLFVDEGLRKKLFSEDAQNELNMPFGSHILDLFEEAKGRPNIDQCLYVDLKSYMVDNCLVKMDRMSMACSLEARVPLLDHELVELAFQMPDNFKINNGQTKVLLKKLAATYVPRDCVYRPKEGFSIPIKNWLCTTLRPLMEDLLSRENLTRGGLFNPVMVEKLKTEHLEGRANHSHVLWSLLVFHDWLARWKV